MPNNNIRKDDTLDSQIKKVKVKYITDSDYYPIYVNGTIGGPSSKGEIVLNFFSEINDLPTLQVHEYVDSKIGKELINERHPKPVENGVFTITRKIHCGIILNKGEAQELYKFLGANLAKLEELDLRRIAQIKESSSEVKVKKVE